jgi:hypothetical protein
MKDLFHICQRTFSPTWVKPWKAIRSGVPRLTNTEHLDWEAGKHNCRTYLAKFHGKNVSALPEKKCDELCSLDRQSIFQNLFVGIQETPEFVEWMADRVASFGGSGTFIIPISLIVWVMVNIFGLMALRWGKLGETLQIQIQALKGPCR